MPTKTLRITTRKTPCGEGSKTWDKFQMRIHKRVSTIKVYNKVVDFLAIFYDDCSIYTIFRLNNDVDIERPADNDELTVQFIRQKIVLLTK